MLVPVERHGSVEQIDLVPSKIIGIGVNYRAHAVEMGKGIPEEPLMFLKPRSALLPEGFPIERPAGYDQVHYEGELGVVIGRRCRRVSVESALDYVFGYTVVCDVTARDLQKKDGQWARAKGFDTFCPTGPFVVGGVDPGNLRLSLTVDGVLKQQGTTADMVFDVAKIVAHVSSFTTLLPGDLIATGTPEGVGALSPGNTVEVSVESVGTLRFTVAGEA